RLARWPHGLDVLSPLGVFVLGVLQLRCQPRQGGLTLGETFAMSFRRGHGYLVLCRFDRLSLLVDPFLSRRQRRLEFLSGALLMPVGRDHLLAAIVGMERPMVNHALEAVFLYLVALPVHPGPLGHFQERLNLWRGPVHQGLALDGLDHDKVSGIIRLRLLPRPAINPRAIRKGV